MRSEIGKTEPVFELTGIKKVFPGTVALDRVSLHGHPGEVVGLVGENGAGKSTLMKILAGIYPHGAFEGSVRVGGEERRFASVMDAERAGVVLIPQELAVVPAMSVAENLFLNREPTRFGLVDFVELNRRAREILDGFGVDIHPQIPMGRLRIAHQQIVDIAKALAKQARVLILDEPSSSLTGHETEVLFSHLRSLRSRGLCSVYISHRIDEVQEIADRIVVLRDGRVTGEERTEELSADVIVHMMVGRKLAEMFARRRREPGRPVLEVEGWSVPDPDVPGRWRVRDVSFEVRAGEVLGLFGAVGAGRSELLLSLCGAYPSPGTGTVRIEGKPVTIRSPRDALNVGIAPLTEDRQRYGLQPWMDVKQNLTLSILGDVSRLGVVNEGREEAVAATQVRNLKITARSLGASMATLSGGNQQKVILGRALLREPKVLLLDDPTRGIDVGAKADIFRLLDELGGRGLAVVFVSSEATEVIGASDRILVLREGQVVGVHDAAAMSVETLVAEATGGVA